MENTPALIQLPDELIELKKTAELKTQIDVDDILFRFAPYFKQIQEVKKDFDKVNFESPSELDSEIADRIRKKLVKIRTGADKDKVEMNKDYLLVQKIVNSANNMVASICKLDENRLDQVANYLKIKEEKRLALLKQERAALMIPYGFNADDAEGLEKMSDEVWLSFLSGIQKTHNDKLIAEQEKVARLKREEEERVAEKAENDKLKAQLAEEKAKADAERKAAEAEAAFQLKLKQKQLEEFEAKVKAERKAADELTAKLTAEAQEAIKKAQEEKRKAEQVLIDKAAAELLETERLRQLAKRNAAAPDKIKIQNAVRDLIFNISEEDLNSPEAKEIFSEIKEKLFSFKIWTETKIKSL